MFGQINDNDKQVTPLVLHKRFTVQKYDSVDTSEYLGVMALQGVSGSLSSLHNFSPSSSISESYVSGGRTFTYYKELIFEQVRHNFFEFSSFPNKISQTQHQPQYTLDTVTKPWGRGQPSSSGQYHWEILNLRKLHNQVNVLSVPQRLYGERIKSGSIELTDYSTGSPITIKDDGYGNLYDSEYESNFLSASLTSEGSGSSVGSVSYHYGFVMITDTGSYSTVTQGTGSNGWILKFDSTKTIYEHEYTCIVPEGTFNQTTNISVTLNRSGSLTIPSGSGLDTFRKIMHSPAESSYNLNGYNSTGDVEGFVTHSFFAPYITTIGLYNDHGDLLAVSKLSRPIRNDPELALSFVVKFDI
jgi:hypothetical protein